MSLASYWRLARFDKPVGIYLLWAPTAWALWIANQGKPAPWLVFVFLLGTVFMRAAGCVVNDLADMDFDKHVRRTQARPLARSELSQRQALIFFAALLIPPALCLYFLPISCYVVALLSLMLTIIYPLCKRWLSGPQLVLSLAFSMGIPMAFLASGAALDARFPILMAITIPWIVVYDTQYAVVDKADDIKVGIRSTALWFGNQTNRILVILQFAYHSLWLVLAAKLDWAGIFYVGWGLALLNILYQQWLMRQHRPELAFKAFLANGTYGLLMWLCVIVAYRI